MPTPQRVRRAARVATTAWLLAGALLLAACQRPTSAGGVPDSTFVATMVALRKVHGDTSLSVTAMDSARSAVLRAHGLTAGNMERAARALAGNPKHAMAVFREIDKQAAAHPAPLPPTPAPRRLLAPPKAPQKRP